MNKCEWCYLLGECEMLDFLGCAVILGLLWVTPGDEIRLVGTATICGHVMCNEASAAQFAVQVRDAGLTVLNRGGS